MLVILDANASAPSHPITLKASKLALKACREKSAARIVFDELGGEVVTEEGQSLAPGIAIVPQYGNQPLDWRRVVPTDPDESNGVDAVFNALYVADFAKAASDMGKLEHKSGGLTIRQSGYSAALCLFEGVDAFGVIMPRYSQTGQYGQALAVLRSIRQGEAMAIAAE